MYSVISRAILIGALSCMLAGVFVAAGTWATHTPMTSLTPVGTTTAPALRTR